MSHKYTPAPAHTHAHAMANAPTPAPAEGGSTCVTHKWLIPLDIRPSHAFAFVGMCYTHAPAALCSRLQPCHPLMLS
ncbi:hypothetical protein O181_071987 [Austropuccinia psidii MF-1]|uniref:Uncharacterized protein n=1 Tax=Austropuccinia psidii MF-1 TaxID=1389203 RepID=A0A9Q3I9Q0_9BASI|nr:hypothetical protein [Austropuccinia psidii MF-1]